MVDNREIVIPANNLDQEDNQDFHEFEEDKNQEIAAVVQEIKKNNKIPHEEDDDDEEGSDWGADSEELRRYVF